MFLKGENYRNQISTHLMGLNISLIYWLLHNLLLSPRFISSYWEPSVPRTMRRANAHTQKHHRKDRCNVRDTMLSKYDIGERRQSGLLVWVLQLGRRSAGTTDTFPLGEGKARGSNLADNSERVSQGTVMEKVRPFWSNRQVRPLSLQRPEHSLSWESALRTHGSPILPSISRKVPVAQLAISSFT